MQDGKRSRSDEKPEYRMVSIELLRRRPPGRGEILNVRHEHAKKRKAAKDVKRRRARGGSYRCGRWSTEFRIDSF
jgi:hypothetical protein